MTFSKSGIRSDSIVISQQLLIVFFKLIINDQFFSLGTDSEMKIILIERTPICLVNALLN